jgi:hypothetical protein
MAVALFAAHWSEGQEFARLVTHAQPAWLLLGLLLQMGTYIADARIWQRIIMPLIHHQLLLLIEFTA